MFSVNVPVLRLIVQKVFANYFIRYIEWYYDAAEKIITDRRKQPVWFKFLSLVYHISP